ncbi:MAG: hypothetical protein NTW87_29340 [Planctomycetota bacterium]|nr:hypothetical protein [Planctomycetota bacterium]
MWRTLGACVCVAFLLGMTSRPAAATDTAKEYKAGDGEGVKGWGCRDLQAAKELGQPFCVYVYDVKNKRNLAAKFYEEVLAKPEVKEKLKGFFCVKIKSDGSDSKGWPSGWLERSANGGTLVLATSDFVQTLIFDKLNKDTVNPAGVAKQLAGITTYEEQRKALLLKAGVKLPEAGGGGNKPPMPLAPVDEKNAKAVLGLGGDKKPEEKKPPKKKVDGPTEE